MWFMSVPTFCCSSSSIIGKVIFGSHVCDLKYRYSIFLIKCLESDAEDADSYEAISELEQRDLEQLMASCQSAVSNAETFMDGLAKELAHLDEVIFANF